MEAAAIACRHRLLDSVDAAVRYRRLPLLLLMMIIRHHRCCHPLKVAQARIAAGSTTAQL